MPLLPRGEIERIPGLLSAAFGEPRPRSPELLPCLIKTILSQNTNDRLRDRAFEGLLELTGGDLLRVGELSLNRLEEAIRPAGLPTSKARAIKEVVSRWEELRGACGMEPQDALALLCSVKGVGPKTARVCLLFSCGHPFFPVDTHIARVARRVGLAPLKASRERIARVLEQIFPPESFYSLHINMIRLGREFCRPRRPRCQACPLGPVCRRVGIEV